MKHIRHLLEDTSDLNQSDILNLKYTFAASFFGFFFVYFISQMLLEARKSNKHFQNLKPTEKADYLSRVGAILHAILSAIIGTVSVFYGW